MFPTHKVGLLLKYLMLNVSIHQVVPSGILVYVNIVLCSTTFVDILATIRIGTPVYIILIPSSICRTLSRPISWRWTGVDTDSAMTSPMASWKPECMNICNIKYHVYQLEMCTISKVSYCIGIIKLKQVSYWNDR